MMRRVCLPAMMGVIAMLAACGGAPSDAEFMELAKSGSADEVAEAIKAGADVNYATDRDGTTPLMTAARNNTADVVKVLIDGGADALATDRANASALRFAVTYNTLEAVQALIEAGSDIELKNSQSVTVLMAAAVNSTADVVEALLEAGADPQAKVPFAFDHLQNTALFLAEPNVKIETADRLRLLSMPLSEPLDAALARRDEIAAERDANPPVFSQRTNQDPTTGLAEGTFVVRDTGSVQVTYGDNITDQASQYLARGIEPADLGMQNYILADLAGSSTTGPSVQIQLFPVPEEIIRSVGVGDTVRAYGYFHWGTYDNFTPHLVRRSGNDALMYVLEIETL